MVALSCTGTGERVCLAAEGFGNRQCFLEGITDRVRTIHELLYVWISIFHYLISNTLGKWCKLS